MASERNEMQRAASLVANEFVSHGTKVKSKPRPFKAERVGHPEKLNQSLSVDVLEWYHSNMRVRQLKKRERVSPRPPFGMGLNFRVAHLSRCVTGGAFDFGSYDTKGESTSSLCHQDRISPLPFS
jgi:hypothetical protein